MTDMRDPKAVGEALLNELTDMRTNRKRWSGATAPRVDASIAANYLPRYEIPDHDANPSCIDKYGPAQGKKPE